LFKNVGMMEIVVGCSIAALWTATPVVTGDACRSSFADAGPAEVRERIA